jgi:hypothetical protein
VLSHDIRNATMGISKSCDIGAVQQSLSRFKLTVPLTPWDTRAYDTYTVIPFSLGSVGTCRLIGINSNYLIPPDQDLGRASKPK